MAAAQRNWQAEQKLFLRLAHTLDKPIRQELRTFAHAVGFAEDRQAIFFAMRYRLRKEIHAGQVTWWIEKDIPPADRYRCAAYRVELRQTAAGENKLVLQSGRQEYPIDLNNLSILHNTFCQAGDDPALIIPRQMGPAYD